MNLLSGKRKRSGFAALFLSLLFLICCILPVSSAHADNCLEVSFSASNSWNAPDGTCYQYDVSLKNNTSARIDGWEFILDLAGARHDQSWNCVISQEDNLLTVSPMEWNAGIEAGQEISGIGIVLASGQGDVFSGRYLCDPDTGILIKTEGPEPTTVPEPTNTPQPTEAPQPTKAPDPIHHGSSSYPSGTGMYGPLSLNGVDLCNADGVPVQLRGVSTHGLAWFPQYVNSETFRYLRDEWGVNLIRLAMYTAESGGYCSDGNQAYLEDLIDNGVNACTSLGMYCIIDWHILQDHDPNINKEAALDFFSRMSEKYSGNNNVIYEICNEPNGSSWTSIKQYADEVIPVIRANSPDSIIIVGTNTWSQDVLDPASNPVADPYNVMYAVHFYAATHGQFLRDRVVSARNSGVPVFVSEFSTCEASGNGAINYSEADAWKDLIMNGNLSYAGWNLANKDESSSILKSSCSKLLDWSDDEISDTGKWLRTLIQEGKALEPDIIISGDDPDTLILPAMLTTIEEEAFEGIRSEYVIIPGNVETIGSRAFADSPNLKKVTLESSSTVVAEDAFEGCQEVELERPGE